MWNALLLSHLPQIERRELEALERWWLHQVDYDVSVDRTTYAQYWSRIHKMIQYLRMADFREAHYQTYMKAKAESSSSTSSSYDGSSASSSSSNSTLPALSSTESEPKSESESESKEPQRVSAASTAGSHVSPAKPEIRESSADPAVGG